ncbi:MAG: hypothetical protein R3D26_20380 [Cyanobacteriota/Melainabacteria group bacterium]
MKPSRHEHAKMPAKWPSKDDLVAEQARQEKTAPVVAVFAAGAGLAVMLIGFGVIPVDRATVHAPMWIIAVVGGAFMCSGLSVLFTVSFFRGVRFLSGFFGFLTLVLMLTVMTYFVYIKPGMPLIFQFGVGLVVGIIALLIVLSYIPGSGVTRISDGRTMAQRLEDKRSRQ